MIRLRSAVASASALAALLATSGCNLSHFGPTAPAASALPSITGVLHGGQQPISGAVIQLYSTNTTAARGASTALVSSVVRTDSNGNFSLTGDYTCPSADALVYLVATGGNPGLSGNVNNTAIALMTVLGTCGTLSANTFLSVNELTTVAAVQALVPFMLDYAHVGADAANAASLATAFASATAFVDPFTGSFRASSNGVVVPTALLNTLADILAVCINTSGGVAGDTTICGKLFGYTANGTLTTSDTILAMLHIAEFPTLNIAQIFALLPANSPFLPALTSPPLSFALISAFLLDFSVSHLFDQLLADSRGHIWLLQPFQGTLSQFDSNLTRLHTYDLGSILAGGTALHMALDPNDNLFVPLGSSLLKIGPDGTILSPPTGYPLITGSLIGYATQSFTSDSSGNIWGIVVRTSDQAVCLLEYSNNGALLSPATGYCGPQTLATMNAVPTTVVADSSGNAYLFFFGTSSAPIEKFSPSGTVTSIPTATYYATSGYYGAVYDPKYSRIWATDTAVLDNLKLDGTVASSTFNTSYIYAVLSPFSNGLALDGAGDLWVATELGSIAEVSPSGKVLSPCTVTNLCGIPVFGKAGGSLAGIAVNPAGDVFTVNATDGTLLKFPGIASAK